MNKTKNNTRELEAVNARLQMAYKIGKIGAWSIKLEETESEELREYFANNLAYNNDEFLEILGLNKTKSGLVSKKDLILLFSERNEECALTKSKFIKALTLIRKGKIKKSQLLMKVFIKSTSSYKYVENKFMVTDYDENGKPIRISGVITDETKEVKYKRMLEEIAYKDSIVGTWNKKKLEDDFKKKKIKAQYVAFVDLDNFKGINDEYGHFFGDKCLFAFTNRIKHIKKTDIFKKMEIYRVYGDEFVICFSVEENEIVTEVLDKFFKKMKKEYIIEGISLVMDFSMGVVNYDRDQFCDLMCMLNKADKAMYKIKGSTTDYKIEE